MIEGSPNSDRASGESLPIGEKETHLKHYFYFECIDAAKAFSEMFRSRHVDASLDRSADGSSWGVYIRTQEKITPDRLDELRRGFEELVEGFEGEYDGWEYMPAYPTKDTGGTQRAERASTQGGPQLRATPAQGHSTLPWGLEAVAHGWRSDRSFSGGGKMAG